MALGAYEKTPYEGKWPSTIIESFVVYEIIEYAVYPNWWGDGLENRWAERLSEFEPLARRHRLLN